MPFLLYTYLATEILAPFFAGLIIINAILFLGKLMPFLEIIFGFGIGSADFIRICAYLVPNMLLFSIPMASTLGVIIAFTRLAGDNEIMALKAAGVGLYRMLPPVIMVAIATAALTALSSSYLIPKGTVAMKQLLYQLAKEKVDKGLREKQFSDGIDNVVIYVDHIDPRTKQWSGVYVSDMRDTKNPLTIIARAGNLKAQIDKMILTLNLTEGTMHQSRDNVTHTVEFATYTLKLPISAPTTIGGDSATHIGKNGMTPPQLWRKAKEYGPASENGKGLLIEFHKRLALPVGCFILTLLGLPLALQSRPGQRPIGLPLGLSFFVLYYLFLTAGKTFSESSTLPVYILMWLPNLLFTLLAVWLIRSSAREQTNAQLEWLLAQLHNLAVFLRPHKARENRP